MDYIALGHVHKRTDIGKIGNTFCAYCGCSEGQGFDEVGEKGVYIGTVSKGKTDLEFKSVCRRMHITEDVNIEGIPSSPEIADAILSLLSKKYGENFSENLYTITLTGATDKNSEINIAEILERLENKVYFAKIKDKTEPQINLSEIASENSLKGIFVKKMLEKINLDDENKQRYIYALKIGLKAFNTEGELYEDK
jgi:DNA repair exonuclease SbcCD nuclease subunit